jgi:hypothetical protein
MKFKEWEKKNNKECGILLPSCLSADIDEFIEVHRPFLLGSHTDYVFRPSSFCRPSKDPAKRQVQPTDPNAPIDGQWYTQRWYEFTGHFIGKPQFASYAMRHIVTTGWLKENPDGLLVAATILDDDVQRVIDNYAHLRKQDLYRHYERHYEATVERVLTGAVAHEPLQQIPACYLDTIVTAIENARNRGQSLEEVEIAMKAILRSVKGRQAMRKPHAKAT